MFALLKLTGVLAGIVFLLSRKWNLGLVLLLASVAVGLLFGHPLPAIGRDVALATVDVLTLRLALAVVLIMTLGELLRQTAGLQGMVTALQALVTDGWVVIAALPALIGLLPMIGGAMFSAPMVDEVGQHLGVNAERKTFVNYWFRHIWEPIFPVYPSMLLAAELLGLSTLQLARATLPLTATAILGGLLFGLLGLPHRASRAAPATSRGLNLRILASSIWPVALVIALSMTLPVDERYSLILSLLVTITLLMLAQRIPLRGAGGPALPLRGAGGPALPLGSLGAILRYRIPWKTVVVIFGALIFRRVLDESGAVLATSQALTELHIPLSAVAFAVPFIAGLLTGLMAAAYSIAFPVVYPLVAVGGGAVASSWVTWLMVGGFLGTMLSPVHLCLALTREYFQARWGPIYRLLVPSSLLIVGVAAGILWLA
jgi:hypothetical protein